MFDQTRFADVLSQYKRDFDSVVWKNEEHYKWRAVKCFQENWDIDSPVFTEMLGRALEKDVNLLTTRNRFPKGMIMKLATAAPEVVRSMFVALFDESRDVVERIESFKQNSAALLAEYGNGAKQHYQDENAITTYLWLRYPDKYYIYRLRAIQATAKELKADYSFKKGHYAENIRNFLQFYDELNQAIKTDEELVNLLRSHLTDELYPDPELKTLTVDFAYYVYAYYNRNFAISTNDISEALLSLNDSNRYSEDNESEAELFAEDEERALENDNSPEIIDPSALHSEAAFKKWFSPIVDYLSNHGGSASRLEVHNALIEQFHLSEEELKKKGEKSGLAIIPNQFDWARNYLNYEGFLESDSPRGVWALSETGRNIMMTDELAGKIIAKWVIIKAAQRKKRPVPTIDLKPYYAYRKIEYLKENFLKEVFMDGDSYDRLVAVLNNKKNIILQGAPGVGKTFAARRLAWSIMGEKDDSRIEFVQFHQSYSYEDFVMGYKPIKDGFELKYGVFYRFCQKASSMPKKEFFFIIDEINRGNMSKIFGELLMLIEKDYRGTAATLAYNGISFSVPENLFIIGLMNTADRSLAMIDYALRRRFSFFDMKPGFASDGFARYQKELDNKTLNKLIAKVEELNQAIAADKTLGKGFCIGHSYFCGKKECSEEWLRAVVDFDLIPMLSEYWFDDETKFQHWSQELQGVFPS